jgi:hypothetical protein
MPPKVKPPPPFPAMPTLTDEYDDESTVVNSTKNRSGPIIGIIIAIVVALAVFYMIRSRCVKKREKGWEIRKSVAKCRCCLRPPRSEEDGIKYRLERTNKNQQNQQTGA